MKTTDIHITSPVKKLEIVIIDNDPIACLIQQTKVRTRFPQPLHVFEDAREAMELLSSSLNTNFLVLLDIDMPSMDGWEFLSEWQKKETKSNIKVIMLSCSISTADKERSKRFAEVAEYFEKPLYDSHLEKMEKVIASFQ